VNFSGLAVLNSRFRFLFLVHRGKVLSGCHLSKQNSTYGIMPQIAAFFTSVLMMLRKSTILVFLFSMSFCMGAQLPILERPVSIDVSGKRVTEVFNNIEEQAQFSFSYNSKLIPEEKLVTLEVKDRPVREVLKKMFGESLNYKQRGNFLIISKAPKAQENEVIVSGYVENNKGEPVPNTTVYDPNTLASANTDEFGYYEMKMDRSEIPLELSVSKSSYKDTLMPVGPGSSNFQNIVIEQDPVDSTIRATLTDIAEGAKSGWYQFVDFMFPDNPETINISDTLYRDFQFSLFPYVGTNRKMSGNVINDYSLNLFAGYSMGTRRVEIAGFANINRSNVGYLQIAGFANLSGGNIEGCQIAGFANTVKGDVDGCQIGGFANTVAGDVRGAQISGFTNVVSGSMDGVQIAGFSNVNLDTSRVVMIAGFSNQTLGDSEGAAIAGFANVHVGNYKGTQVSGFVNLNAGDISGSQVSGFCNIAKNVKGTQVAGFFNYADSISGVPLAFLSFVRKGGYHKLELSYNEMYPFNVALRTGVPAFYNILQAGMDFDSLNDTTKWSFGYGIGTAPKLSNKLRLTMDLSCNQMNYGNNFDYLNLLNKFDMGLEWQIVKGFALGLSASFNVLLRENNGIYPYTFSEYNPNIVDTWDNSDYNARAWIGWKVALRFF
jgi:outer membrane lipoprotein SlyB